MTSDSNAPAHAGSGDAAARTDSGDAAARAESGDAPANAGCGDFGGNGSGDARRDQSAEEFESRLRTDGGTSEASTGQSNSAGTGRADETAENEVSDPILRVEGVRKSFGGVVANEGVTFGVERGSITGLIGPNGAGKSTLFNCITGFYEPDAGTVAVDGADVTGGPPHEVARRGLIRSFQTPRKPEGMTVREALLVGPQRQTGESITGILRHGDRVEREEREALARADELLARFGIDHLAGAPATELSGGQTKLVELARAMMAEPDLLLLDEPVAGVNPTLANKLKRFLRELNDDGVTFLIVEHDMGFIMDLADTIVVLDRGSVLTSGTPEEIRSDERVIDAYLGGGR